LPLFTHVSGNIADAENWQLTIWRNQR